MRGSVAFILNATLTAIGTRVNWDVSNLLEEPEQLNWPDKILDLQKTSADIRATIDDGLIEQHTMAWKDLEFVLRFSERVYHAHDLLRGTGEASKLRNELTERVLKLHPGGINKEVKAVEQFLKHLPTIEENVESMARAWEQVTSPQLQELLWQAFMHYYALLVDEKDYNKVLNQTQAIFGDRTTIINQTFRSLSHTTFTTDMPFRRPEDVFKRAKKVLDLTPNFLEWSVEDWMGLAYYFRFQQKPLESIVILSHIIIIQESPLESTAKYLQGEIANAKKYRQPEKEILWPSIHYRGQEVFTDNQAKEIVLQAELIVQRVLQDPPLLSFSSKHLDRQYKVCTVEHPDRDCSLFSCLVSMVHVLHSDETRKQCLQFEKEHDRSFKVSQSLLLPSVHGIELYNWLLRAWNMARANREDQEAFILDVTEGLLKLEKQI